jgi:fructokinase
MITVIGEALIELAPTPEAATLRALPGGSALNVAVAAARLGCPAALIARLSRDPFGQLLRRHAARNRVDLTGAPDADEPTAIALAPGAGLGRDVRSSLYFSGTPSWQWRAGDLAWIPPDTTVLHIGSLVWSAASSVANVLRAASRLRQRGALVCMDLTVHPEVMRTPGQGRILLERSLKSADVIRTSIEDIGWLYSGRSPQAVAEQWLRMGPELVIITCGAAGAMAFRGLGSVLHRPAAYPAGIVDTVGADDSFTAGLLATFHRHRGSGDGRRNLTAVPLAEALDLASLVAGMTCERPGADPPTFAEVNERRDQRFRSRAAVSGGLRRFTER